MTDTSTTTQTPLERDLAALTAAPALDSARPLWQQALAQHDAAPAPAPRSIFKRPINQRYAAAAGLLLLVSAAIIAAILPARSPGAYPAVDGGALSLADLPTSAPFADSSRSDGGSIGLAKDDLSRAVAAVAEAAAPTPVFEDRLSENASRSSAKAALQSIQSRSEPLKPTSAPAPSSPAPAASAPATATPAFDPSLFYDRLVIRKANIDLKTSSPSQAALKAAALVNPADGEFIQSSNALSDISATVTLRVRSARVDDVLAQLRALGTVTTETQSGEDVTDQMVDLEARLRNERRIETELIALVEARRGAPLGELMSLRENLDRARERIERLAAQRERVGRQVALATIQASFSSPDTPAPTKASEDTFLDRLALATSRGLEDFGRSITKLIEIILGGLLVWIGLGLLALIFIILFRRALRPNSYEPPPRA